MGTVPISWQMGTVPITLPGMGRTVVIYGALLAVGAVGLQWLQYQMLVRTHPAEIYLAAVGATDLLVSREVARGRTAGLSQLTELVLQVQLSLLAGIRL